MRCKTTSVRVKRVPERERRQNRGTEIEDKCGRSPRLFTWQQLHKQLVSTGPLGTNVGHRRRESYPWRRHLRLGRPLCVRGLWQRVAEWVRGIVARTGNRTSLPKGGAGLEKEAGALPKVEIQENHKSGYRNRRRNRKHSAEERRG